MKTVGLTGGIGSGKSTVAKVFEVLGVSIFNSDYEAKNIMTHDVNVRKQIVSLLGESAYDRLELNRTYIAEQVFNAPALRDQLNEIVHPAVRQYFKLWAEQQKGNYVLNEAAILFETGAYQNFDATVLVIAPEEIRVKRTMERDNVDRDQVVSRIKAQWPDGEKMRLADHIITNNDQQLVLPQIMQIHRLLNATS